MLKHYQTDLPNISGKWGIVIWPKVKDYWPDKAESEWHINFYNKIDDLSNASLLSDRHALHDFSQANAGKLYAKGE